MRTLIIPDIHNKVELAQRILDDNPAERRVFLGDIYDDFDDTLADVQKAARWHKEQLADPRNTFLFGNHDMPYAFEGNPLLRCSGYTLEKAVVINSILTPADWAKGKLAVTIDGWLISHAGLHLALCYNVGPDLENGCAMALLAARRFSTHPLIDAGVARGGRNGIGGLTWLDWDREFEPVDGTRQIVGHTPHDKPQNNNGNWCLDTHLRHAAILTDGALEIIATSTQRTPNSAALAKTSTRTETGAQKKKAVK